MRFHNHLLTNNRQGSKLVQRSVAKYGLNNFIYAILEYYPYIVTKDNNEELLALETSYIALLFPKYNIETEAGRFFGYKTKDVNLNDKLNLIKLSLLDERKQLLKSIKDKHLLEYDTQRRNHLREIANNRPKDYISPEGLDRIVLGSSKVIYLKSSLDDAFNMCEFKNVNTAAHYLCCSTKTIQRALHKGFIYVPSHFLPFLNQSHIDNHLSIINHIDEISLEKFYRYTFHKRGKTLKLKATLSNKPNFVKIYISSVLARTL
ncbi:hypothetical protein KGF54_005126 (mitochondrion) [Candida jiufengensis]|nr:hypothetical protein KGF54_005126 [Candida jiufengensis]